MIHTFIAERCSDLPVSACCRVMGVSTSGFHQRRNQPVTACERVEADRANVVFDIWKMSRHSYGSYNQNLWIGHPFEGAAYLPR